MAGDFNDWPIGEITQEHSNLTDAEHEPTRDNKKLDKIFVNFWQSVNIYQTLRPLEAHQGAESNHIMVYLEGNFVKTKAAKICYSYRRYANAGADMFVDLMHRQSWENVYREASSNDNVALLDLIFTALLDRCFPFKTTTRRDTDPPLDKSHYSLK